MLKLEIKFKIDYLFTGIKLLHFKNCIYELNLTA